MKKAISHPMFIELDVSLDPTLGCGQAHRWKKTDGSWKGILGNEVITLTEKEGGFECTGTSNREMILRYFRSDDDLKRIYDDISSKDPYVARLAKLCPGMRILRQDPWECTATYLLATNANVKRIGHMVESVCKRFGRDMGGIYSFPTPEEILARESEVCECGLGYRSDRFSELAHLVADKEIDLYGLNGKSYEECVETLLEIKGVGNKVADCIALFSYGHLQAVPIDARIEKVLRERYGRTGSYKVLSEFSRNLFGEYAGYAQELLYHCTTIEESQAQDGGLQPI